MPAFGWASAIYTALVYTVLVKNITLSADEHLIDRAREIAHGRHTTLNAEFRDWLKTYTGREHLVERYRSLMKELSYVNTSGRKFTRDELNARH